MGTEFIADLHIHSKYSRATSTACEPEQLAAAAVRKGIDILGTGDFTHALYRKELCAKLVPGGDGLYSLKGDINSPKFIVSGEISCIYKKNGKVRKIHMLILLPSLEAAQLLSRQLESIGNLHSDGRPILGLDAKELCRITLEVCPEAILIPAHIWTPHFSLFGAYSGFESIEECFEEITPHIAALETGLSSDPIMNETISALDRYALVSNSDAHSPANIGREANIFTCEQSYTAIREGLRNGNLAGTLEFYPEEGKYHWDGHRLCGIGVPPSEAERLGGICPVCAKPMTAGVLHRVEQLSDRPQGLEARRKRKFEYIVPLIEVVAGCIGTSVTSKKTVAMSDKLVLSLGSELHILRKAEVSDIAVIDENIAEGIRRMRAGQVRAIAGYDGQYGTVELA